MAVKQDTASATLEGLRQIGSGWHLSVAAAIARGDHKTLGMDRREFAEAAGGFKLMDPREAIIELHKQGMSQVAIAEILGVAPDRTVNRILAEEKLVAPQKRISRAAGGTTAEASRDAGDTDGTADDLEEELDALRRERDDAKREAAEAKMAAEQARRSADDEIKRRTQDLNADLKQARKDRIDLQRQLDATRNGSLSEADRTRLEKEREAMLAELEARFAPLHVSRAVEGLHEATESLRELIELGATSSKHMAKIERAHDAFIAELEVALAASGE